MGESRASFKRSTAIRVAQVSLKRAGISALCGRGGLEPPESPLPTIGKAVRLTETPLCEGGAFGRGQALDAVRFIGGEADIDCGGAFVVCVERLLFSGCSPTAPPATPAVAEVEAILLRLHGAFQHIEQEGGRRGQLGVADTPSGQYGEELVPDAVNGLKLHPGIVEHHLI